MSQTSPIERAQPDGVGRRAGYDWRDARLLALVLALTAIVLCKDITVGGFRYGDSAVHAMDGVLIRDWVAAGPQVWGEPMAFAEQQYAHYPALGIGSHYPPGFAIVEAGFFALFGISIVTARLCVVFFGLMAAAGTYAFVRLFGDRFAAALCAITVITIPATTQWGRQVMLELPTLAIIIVVAIAVVKYIDRPTGRRIGLALAAGAVALLFRQTALFVFPTMALTIAAAAMQKRVPWRHAVVAAIAACVAVAGVMLSLDGHATQLLIGAPTFSERWSLGALTFYLRALPSQTGYVVLALALVGLIARRGKWGLLGVFFTVWIGVSYAMVTVAEYKNDRYFFLGLFPIAVCAGLGINALVGRSRRWAPRSVAVTGTMLLLSAVALSFPVAHRPDYGPVVAANADRLAGHAVFFSGLREADFVFAARQHVAWRRTVVLRGSKVLYTCNGRPDLDLVANVDTPAALSRRMGELAFGTLFVERVDRTGVAQERMLRDYVNNAESYRQVASYDLQRGPERTFRDVTLDVFEPVSPTPRTVERVDVLIPRSKRIIRVDLRNWS